MPTKMAIKIKGTPSSVKKALSGLLNTEAPKKSAVTLREADFRSQAKKK